MDWYRAKMDCALFALTAGFMFGVIEKDYMLGLTAAMFIIMFILFDSMGGK